MSEHTPGPWFYDELVQICEVDRPYMRVAFLPSDHERYASSKANGRLIAAAPDLLAALQEIIERNEIQHWFNLDQARAAVAKATGETAPSSAQSGKAET